MTVQDILAQQQATKDKWRQEFESWVVGVTPQERIDAARLLGEEEEKCPNFFDKGTPEWAAFNQGADKLADQLYAQAIFEDRMERSGPSIHGDW